MMKIIKKITALSLILVIVLAVLPAMSRNVRANDGIIYSNDPDSALSVFGSGNVTAGYESSVLTITLNNDISLQDTIRFAQGNKDDKVILDLNGYTLTGVHGVAGNDIDAANGQDAIAYYPIAFDLEIKGPGTVNGGSGAVYESAGGYRYGADGGNALRIEGPVNEEFFGKLEYGVSITGGALLRGGDGAGLTKDEWQYSFESYSKDPSGGAPHLSAGNGGAGIVQPVLDLETDVSYPAYSKIEVIDGTVEGGTGGGVDWSGVTPTVYALMVNSLSETVMQGQQIRYADDCLGSLMKMNIGSGGDGIRFGTGRKYVLVGEDGTVKGGDCGSAEFGSGKTYNRYEKGDADPGDGIAVYGDIGLTNDAVDPDTRESKTADSNDMGMYIAGNVTGGNSPDAYALNEDTCDAGAGISLHGETRFGNNSSWGAIDIEGIVSGGKAGDAVSGNAGYGGPGLLEAYMKGDDVSYDSPYGTDLFIVNGDLSGGDGGSSCANRSTTANTAYSTMVYVPALSGSGAYGPGGNGISFGHYRENVTIAGMGAVLGGGSGSTVDRDGTGVIEPGTAGIYIWPEDRINTFEITPSVQCGPPALEFEKATVTVKARMTSFDDQPSADTRLSCTVTKPEGYTGDVYIQWVGVVYPTIGYSGSDYAGFPKDIESSGTDYTKFNLLSNNKYKYLAYPTYESMPDFGMYNYNYDIATADIFSDIANVSGKKQIYCYVMLDDGRWGKSNVMEFTKGWTDESSEPISISAADVTGIEDKTYTGNAVTQSPTVKAGGTVLKSGTDYNLSYRNNKKIGIATMTVTGKGKYTGTVSKTFRILFKDVPASHSFSKAVYWSTDEGIAAGYSGDKEGTFGVSDDITRGQVVMFLWRAAGQPKPGKTIPSFKDVSSSSGFFTAIQWASEKGIAGGYSDKTFRPNDKCTRGQIAMFLWRFAGKPKPAAGGKTFSDVPKSNNFYTAVMWASGAKITAGYSDGTFGVNKNCTRGHCVTFLYRMPKPSANAV